MYIYLSIIVYGFIDDADVYAMLSSSCSAAETIYNGIRT